MTLRLNSQSADFESKFSTMLIESRGVREDVSLAVDQIIQKVRKSGDQALIEYNQKFDHFKITPEELRISAEEIEAGFEECDKDFISALEIARDRISEFHKCQLPEDRTFTDDAGLKLGFRWQPISSVGLYIPGGTAAYPSSMLMNAIPAQVAGVERLAVVSPTPNGLLNPLVMAAAKVLGVTEIYRIGGAQSIAALAYGTETISPVDKIVGPGNSYVATAKKKVFGDVGIDLFAGPSEILVIADGANDPNWISIDLLAQAEHDRSAKAILITDDEKFAENVFNAIEKNLATLARGSIARKSWESYGAIIVVQSLKEAIPLANKIAAEHVEIASNDAEELAKEIRNAGAIFLGRYAPEAVGDYVAGPNHVLPTSGTARFSSGLSTLDFMKRTSLITCGVEGLNNVGPAAIKLAKAEGLDAHALSISIRLNCSE